MKEDFVVKPVYRQIAIDLANRIARGEFLPGTKIQGRSALAGMYNVSPETVRRAVKLLEDMDIVETAQGSGIIVKSADKTCEFINRFKNKDSMASIKHDISKILHEKIRLEEQLTSKIDKLIDYSERFKNSNPFKPVEFKIQKHSKVAGRTISEVKFWQNTGATVIGIRRGSILLLSPGPGASLMAGDILILIGEEASYEKIRNFLNE